MGLETATYISDLVATNPLSSDLASTGDDHMRLIKSTIKATFPNINGAVSATDEELSLLAGKTGTLWTSANDGSGSGLDADLVKGVAVAPANSSGTVTLSAANGSNATYSRSDHGHALDQSIAPTWSSPHTFSAGNSYLSPGIKLSNSIFPIFTLVESGAAANNGIWSFGANAEQLQYQAVNDAASVATTWLSVDRTGTTIDSIALTATALTVNSVALTPVSGTFTIDASGFTAAVNGTARYEKIGNIVVLYIPSLSGTSNSTSFSLSGIPAAIRPARVQNIPVPVTRDNGTDGNLSWVQIATDGTGSVIRQDGAGASTPWTNSGTKALSISTVTYILT